ncbi:hypothetical protein ACFL5O_11540 [Myxococcota bacterium]
MTAALVALCWSAVASAKRPEGRVSAEVGLGLGFPGGRLGQYSDPPSFGFHFDMAVGFRFIPILVGLGAGGHGFGDYRRSGPLTALYQDGLLRVTTTDESLSTTLGGGDVFLRLEPHWFWLRPFLDARLGIMQFRTVHSLLDSSGEVLQEKEAPRKGAVRYGFGGGIRIDPWKPHEFPGRGGLSLTFTLGFLWYRGSSVIYPRPILGEDKVPIGYRDERVPFQFWSPFIGIGFLSFEDERIAKMPVPARSPEE